jgi:hypothetical protein
LTQDVDFIVCSFSGITARVSELAEVMEEIETTEAARELQLAMSSGGTKPGCGKHIFVRLLFILMTIILPRQARDIHTKR